MNRRSLSEYSRIGFLVLALWMAAGTCGCRDGAGDSKRRQPMAGKTIQQVQEEHTDDWMAIPGVVGTAIGQCEGKPCILVFTAANTERVRQKIPLTVEGYPVVVEYTGAIHAR